jgi:hypothetical protein
MKLCCKNKDYHCFGQALMQLCFKFVLMKIYKAHLCNNAKTKY